MSLRDFHDSMTMIDWSRSLLYPSGLFGDWFQSDTKIIERHLVGLY